MNSNGANVVVDVNRSLERRHGETLISELGQLPGVSRAWVSPRAPRLVLVNYDPARTDSKQILGTVSRCGFDARLIGM